MTYGTKIFKNGKRRGYLHFSSGKKVVLKEKDLKDFNFKLNSIAYGGYIKGQQSKVEV